VFDESRMCFFRVDASDRIPIEGLRPQGAKLLHYLLRRNRENGDIPTACSVEELTREVLGSRRVNPKGDLTRLVFDVRGAVDRSGSRRVLEAVGATEGGGYRLITQAWYPANGRASFLCGPPVVHPSGFFGRHAALARIFDLWEREPFQHAVVTGRRRSGKTSLLRYVEAIHSVPTEELRPNQKFDWLADSWPYRFVSVDFRDVRMQDMQLLLRRLGMALTLPVQQGVSLSGFFDLLCEHLSEPTILLMDEIDAGSPAHADFWWGLRSLSATKSGSRLGFLVTMEQGRPRPNPEQSERSRFLDIFGHEIELGPLERDEALELIGSSPTGFADQDVEWILRESGGHPCLLQLLCDSRLRTMESGDAAAEKWKVDALHRIRDFRSILE